MQKFELNLKETRHTIPLWVGTDLWPTLRQYLGAHYQGRTLFLISDSRVGSLYRRTVLENLSEFFPEEHFILFPEGEASKSREQLARLQDMLLEHKAGRDTLLLALGGGVSGDLVGFLAATLHRGVDLIHLPTSLLAQVDSSIGGKVGINHPVGKNLIGAFYQPRAIFTDIRFLDTLAEEEYLNGLGEVIKYAAILDGELWTWLEKEREKILQRDSAILEKIVARCVELKIAVVEKDEKESRYRSILNFGHTVGHAIEKLSHYEVKHGFAVAAGMKIAARLSNQLLGLPRSWVNRLDQLLEAYRLNRTNLADFSLDQLWNVLLTDKKSRRQHPHFTLLKAPQQAELFYPVQKEELERALSAF